MIVQKVFHVSNNLYGNDIVSSFKLAKGYTLPLDDDSSMLEVPREIFEARNVLKAKRKLNLILRYKAVKIPSIYAGNIVDVSVN